MGDTLELADLKYSGNNPWNVTSIYEFYYFCCPECDCKLQNKQDFVNHTANDHPWVSNLMSVRLWNFKDGGS